MNKKASILNYAGLLAVLAMLLMLVGCSVSAFDKDSERWQSAPELSDSDIDKEPDFPIVHIAGVTLPEEYGYGYLDCEAAFWLINHLRELEGLEPFQRADAVFQQATVERLDESVVMFSHVRPNGEKFSAVFAEHNIMYDRCVENLASGQFTAEHVVHDWMESDSHRANLLAADIDKICIACRLDNDGVPYWVFEGVRYSEGYVPDIPDISVSVADASLTDAY